MLEYLKARARLRHAGRADGGRLPEVPGRDATASASIYVLLNTTTGERLIVKTYLNEPELAVAVGVSACGGRPTGWSAKCTTCTASSSRAIPTCGGS